jgi:hypothetical protein
MPRQQYVPILESLRLECRLAIERLLAEVATAGQPAFELVRQILAALPLASEEFCVAGNRLANAQHYVQAGEPGAARFELRLLLRGLDR